MSNSVKLRVPFASDGEKKLYDPQIAEKGKRYFCPACQDTVILKKGEIKTAHFAHKASETCNQETILHKTAKQLIVDVISDWKSGKIDAPILRRTCKICHKPKDQPLPDKVECAALEYRVTGGFIVDVALMVEDKPAAAIEIRVSHAVDENKAKLLSIPFIELEGQKVIENPNMLEPIQDRFRSIICSTCKKTKKQFQTEVNKIAKQTGVELPAHYYRYAFCKCWKCKREIIVFAWFTNAKWNGCTLNDYLANHKRKPQITPIPQTVQYRYLRFERGEYWVNTCPYCKSIQLDHHLFHYGPFLGINCEDSEDAYHRDMATIASNIAKMNG